MQRAELEHLCSPMSPEQALDGLRTLYDALANSAWAEKKDLESVNAGIEVVKGCIHEVG